MGKNVVHQNVVLRCGTKLASFFVDFCGGKFPYAALLLRDTYFAGGWEFLLRENEGNTRK
jgi:hypothetical protein